ncbi:hypothetical protein M409DRAFT_49659 [Zasmidium cellare ATCC 36951]|uniref:Uncharacterized protein n=1 Tax=Zasmidium cellare ATCC 36951 TaxID=1080233 RepID=A0A6A6D160_ZASCE|nr:uncharacterized protein M409DRAFT_49659 [Zasmidium cellare ATCC 36951]KAF2173177.1 hypothetical protein M409DRAFT_49659 [Zasmidium cellare ATCC 36951]
MQATDEELGPCCEAAPRRTTSRSARQQQCTRERGKALHQTTRRPPDASPAPSSEPHDAVLAPVAGRCRLSSILLCQIMPFCVLLLAPRTTLLLLPPPRGCPSQHPRVGQGCCIYTTRNESSLNDLSNTTLSGATARILTASTAPTRIPRSCEVEMRPAARELREHLQPHFSDHPGLAVVMKRTSASAGSAPKSGTEHGRLTRAIHVEINRILMGRSPAWLRGWASVLHHRMQSTIQISHMNRTAT